MDFLLFDNHVIEVYEPKPINFGFIFSRWVLVWGHQSCQDAIT